MATHTDTFIDAEPLATEESAPPSQAQTEVSLLDLTVLLVANKRFILRFVLGAALLAVVVALLLPVRYEAKVMLLPPQQNSSIASALLGQIGNLGGLGSLGSLAGGLGIKTPADMYISHAHQPHRRRRHDPALWPDV